MNPDEQLDALLHAAREVAPDTDRAEFGFETRVMARLREDRRGSFVTWAWRLSPFFAALAVAAAVWSYNFTGIEADASYALDAVRSVAEPQMASWLTEDAR